MGWRASPGPRPSFLLWGLIGHRSLTVAGQFGGVSFRPCRARRVLSDSLGFRLRLHPRLLSCRRFAGLFQTGDMPVLWTEVSEGVSGD